MAKSPRLIAFYLPQYYPIPENDEWWGKGFTEWSNVAKARPLFKGHYQPHLPADLGFYDLRLPEVRQAQADMAREYGIHGFCYYHYWFAGRQLLERPLNEVLSSGKPDFPFCIAWANQTWTGIWHGAPDRILIEQTYPGVIDDQQHFDALLPAFSDSRYILVDGKPLFIIYQPRDITTKCISTWRDLALSAGLKGLYIVGNIGNKTDFLHIRDLGFDAYTISRISGRENHLPKLQKFMIKILGIKRAINSYQNIFNKPFYIIDATKIAAFQEFTKSTFLDFLPCVIPNWDNTPRSGINGIVFKNTDPSVFQNHLSQALQRVDGYSESRKIVLIKSWNEWAEGNYLEPDQKYRDGFLAEIKKVLFGI